jgi:hypothetical protein
MRVLFLYAIVIISAAAFGADSSYNDTFKNFGYPFAESKAWPHHLRWLDLTETHRVMLVNGRWRDPDSGSDERFRGLTLESVQLGDVIGDGKQAAIVVLRFDTGGTQYSHYVYIYSLQEHRPRLLAYFHSGDRAASGLYRVYAQRGELVVELFDPEKRSGDCCSSRFIRRRFEWKDSRYQQVGPAVFGAPQAPSRLPVDVFGNHH